MKKVNYQHQVQTISQLKFMQNIQNILDLTFHVNQNLKLKTTQPEIYWLTATSILSLNTPTLWYRLNTTALLTLLQHRPVEALAYAYQWVIKFNFIRA